MKGVKYRILKSNDEKVNKKRLKKQGTRRGMGEWEAIPMVKNLEKEIYKLDKWKKTVSKDARRKDSGNSWSFSSIYLGEFYGVLSQIVMKGALQTIWTKRRLRRYRIGPTPRR